MTEAAEVAHCQTSIPVSLLYKVLYNVFRSSMSVGTAPQEVA